jgi:putative ABC transport system substrate-binding protein
MESLTRLSRGLAEQQAGAVLVGTDGFFIGARNHIVTLAARHSMPAIFPFREDATAGGLIGYGPNNEAMFHVVGTYIGRLLRGERVAAMPVQRATRIEMAINLKTAKALSLPVPPTLLARADEVIE